MVDSLKLPVLTVTYLIILFGSLLDVGLGFIQSVNERIDGWSMEQRGRRITRTTRAGIALLCVVLSGALSLIGVHLILLQ